MRRIVIPLLIAVFSAFALSVAAQEGPGYEIVDCPEGVTATECGYLTVPEDRTNPDGNSIRLAVAIVRPQNAFADPVFFLAGGPGEAGLIYTRLAQIFPNRDVIAFDQRGVGLSEPSLACPEYIEALSDTEGATANPNLYNETLIGCLQRFSDEGINVAAFNTTESADDVNDLRSALGYAEINLYGGSYGTRLAQEVIRRHPEALRSVVLDSVIPPEIDRPAETPRTAADALTRVFDACAADTDCDAAYPNLADTYAQLIETLNTTPGTYTFEVDGETQEFPLSGSAVTSILFASLYSAPGVSQVPSIINELSTGNYDILTESAAAQTGEAIVSSVTFGLFFATECRGEIAFSDPAALAATYAELPEWSAVFNAAPGISNEGIYAICEGAGLIEGSGVENDALVSDVPTLLLAGEFDPVTPPVWLEIAADGLSNGFAYEIPGQAHVPGLASECGYLLATAFLADPTTAPDAACLDTQTFDFVLPGEPIPEVTAEATTAP